jgi:flagellar basal-body rod modification protein FlgD
MSTVGAIPASLLQTAQAVSNSTAASGATSNQDINQQQFLTLFIKQLQSQDPLSPLDSNQLTAQLAQFSSLEQLTQMNQKLDSLSGTAQKTENETMLSLIGKKVAFDGSQLQVTSGQSASVGYTLSSSAADVVATVQAADGTTVRTVDIGAKGAGPHSFAFDGRDDSGALVADGTYKVTIAAAATAGVAPTPVSLDTEVTVDGVDLSSDPPALLAGTTRITLDKVRTVHDAGADA